MPSFNIVTASDKRYSLCGELWSRASREAEHLPRLRTLLDELRPTLKPWGKVEPTGLPVLALRLRAAGSARQFLLSLRHRRRRRKDASGETACDI